MDEDAISKADGTESGLLGLLSDWRRSSAISFLGKLLHGLVAIFRPLPVNRRTLISWLSLLTASLFTHLMMISPPPLDGVRVLEFAGLSPGPFTGLLLADWGASVLRIDRSGNVEDPGPTADVLSRRKASIAVNLKSPAAITLIKDLVRHVDVIIDPFRPGVLERLGLSPDEVLLPLNQRLIIGRMTGFRRDGKYAQMAGHDINYIAVSGVLSLLGRKDENPLPPGNILGDFAGGGTICFLGIVLALLQRMLTGKGQVVEANMVDGVSYLATLPRLSQKLEIWNRARGDNLLDSGCPYYDTYKTSDGMYIAVGTLEPQFFACLLKGLDMTLGDVPGDREDRATWPYLRELLTRKFLSKTRKEWEGIFDGTDACVTPVLTLSELEASGYDNRPAVTLRTSPAYAIMHDNNDAKLVERGQGPGVIGEGWSASGLAPGYSGSAVLNQWAGWREGKDFRTEDGGLVKIATARL